MRKANHKHKLGTTVKFKFFDGSIHVGEVVSHNYMGEDWAHVETNWTIAQYTIHVPSSNYSRGYMVYSNITNDRIFSKDDKLVKAKIKSTISKKKPKVDTSELAAAINKQKQFISGKVSK